MRRGLPQEESDRLWNILHATSQEEVAMLRVSEQGVTPDLIAEMRQAREQMGKKQED